MRPLNRLKIDQGGVVTWQKEHSNQKRDKEVENMVSEKECKLRADEKFWLEEELKEENHCQHRPHICGLLF